MFPFWSPDSRFIAYFVPGKLMKVDVGAGPPLVVAPLSVSSPGSGGAWSRSETIVFNGGPEGLSRISANGGSPVTQTRLARGQTGHNFPAFLPDGVHVLFQVNAPSEDNATRLGKEPHLGAHLHVAATTDARCRVGGAGIHRCSAISRLARC
jgi:hypothetical protein